MAKDLKNGIEAREALLRGVDVLANAVKITISIPFSLLKN